MTTHTTHTITAVRNIEWGTKVQLAQTLNIWDRLRSEAVQYLDDTTPPGHGISSSDINHVTMGLVERELADRLDNLYAQYNKEQA